MRSLKRPKRGKFSLKNIKVTRGVRTGEIRDWDDSHKDVKKFKKELIRECLKLQKNRCAYCELELGTSGARRKITLDHFVPKGDSFGYPEEWRFEVFNLFVSCASCNEALKSDYDPGYDWNHNSNLKKYLSKKIKFKICHPYFDNVKEHISGGFSLQNYPSIPVAITEKGENTIELFKLNDHSLNKRWGDIYLIHILEMDRNLNIKETKTVQEEVLFNKIKDELGS